MTIENLVFEGGGVRGIAYAGALTALEEKGYLKNVRRVAGTSAGAMTALLLSIGYNPADIKTILRNMDFRRLEDKPNPLRILSHYALFKGDVLLRWITRQLEQKGFSDTTCFSDLQQAGCLDLNVFATDLNARNIREFSAEKTPNTGVAGAVRASMSIPFFYAAWQFPMAFQTAIFMSMAVQFITTQSMHLTTPQG